MVATYEYVAADLRTNVIRDSVRLSNVTYEGVLNRRGALSASIPRAAVTAARDVLAAGDTALYVLRDGQAVWGGFVHSVQANRGDGHLRLAAQGFLGYYDKRVLRETRTYTGVDQATIMADLVAYASGQASLTYGATVGPGGAIPMARSAPATGTTRDRTYDGPDRPVIGDLLRKMTEVQGGPDMGVVTTLAADGSGTRQFTNTFTVWAKRGAPTTRALILGGEVADYAVTYDAENLGTRVEAMNDADSADRLIVAADSAMPLVWDMVVSRAKVTDQATLASWANKYLAVYAQPLVLPSVELTNPRDVTPGSLTEGDNVRLIIRDGYVQVDGIYRTVAWKVTVGEGGSEQFSLAFAPPDATGGNPDA